MPDESTALSKSITRGLARFQMIKLLPVLVVVVGLGTPSSALAQAVKKWVDDEGVTHYSDQLPGKGATPVEEYQVPQDRQHQSESESINQRIRNKGQQFEAERKQRERAAEQTQRQQAIEEALQRDEIVAVPKKKKKRRKKRRKRQVVSPPVRGDQKQ